jgi:hypothetical protein
MSRSTRVPVGRRPVLGGLVLLLALLLASPSGAAEKRKAENPHERKDAKACPICHVTPPSEAEASRQQFNLRFEGDVVALCGSCHGGYTHMHPVKIAVAPDMKNPEDLPLDKDGKITCATCHDVMEGHGVSRKRRVTGRALCLNCHADSEILASVVWYPTRLKKGATGRLEVKVIEFQVRTKRGPVGDSVLLYYYVRDADKGKITFGTDILYDDGTHGDRKARDGVFTLTERSTPSKAKPERKVYTCWVLDGTGRKSNTINLQIEYE